jgi:hypothetical protein
VVVVLLTLDTIHLLYELCTNSIPDVCLNTDVCPIDGRPTRVTRKRARVRASSHP